VIGPSESGKRKAPREAEHGRGLDETPVAAALRKQPRILRRLQPHNLASEPAAANFQLTANC